MNPALVQATGSAAHSAQGSVMNSAANSRQSSRQPTPLPPLQPQLQQPNPWLQQLVAMRPYLVGGLGAIGLYKLGSFAKNYLYNKFHKIPTYENRYLWSESTPTPEPLYLSDEAYNDPPKHKHKHKYKNKHRQYQRQFNHHP